MNHLTERRRDARADLVQALRSEFLGPAGGEGEVLALRERPTLRYLVGRLAPAGTRVSPDEDDGAADVGTDDDSADTGYASPITMAMNPSSIGLSFLTEPGTKALEVTARWGRYEQEEQQGAESGGTTGSHGVYRRRQGEQRVPVDLSATRPPRAEVEPGVFVEFLLRTRNDGRTAVSVFLVNRIESRTPERPDDDEWVFQPEIIVRAPEGQAAFAPRRLEDMTSTEDADLLANELLYWNRPEYAVGHGCAAEWKAAGDERTPAAEVRSEILPSYELARIDPREGDDLALDMHALGGTGPDGVSGTRLRQLLMSLADRYRDWIDSDLRGRLLPDVPSVLRSQAADHISACEKAHERIVEGIELIASDQQAQEAFCFANRAMALQRERSVRALARRRGEPAPQTVQTSWRPFQLAFILLNLPAMVERRHRDRGVADLLWFPTGGGKTEAYLGLTAFALAHRRIRPVLDGFRNDTGVTVLMRYTLRLLTVQQFQRAATLICACEYLRQNEGVWGDEPFSLGLWVGRSATPNEYSDPQGGRGAKEALQRLADGNLPRRDGGSPVQLLHCPWCGARLTHRERGSGVEKPLPATYQADDDGLRVSVFCSDDDCDFSTRSEGIPAHTVDEQLYRHVPSLVIATVDKFARMPWNGRVQALFGRVDRQCPRHGFLTPGESHPASHRESSSVPAVRVVGTLPLDPPDLVIQDELHLISGPLGTLVGLYETAVDLLSSADVDGQRIGPKVVASTATIRRSEQQVGALFCRRVAIFPPSGIRSTDSWFGTEVSSDDDPGRLYLGLSAPGKSVKTALVRAYAALLSRAKAIHDGDADVGDPYMTLVGYFNSLRELGGALRLIEDDVPGRIGVLHKRDTETWASRRLFEREELTSNKRAEEVPKILEKLERRFASDRPRTGEYPIDTILASNMISVGVDIDRLGLMVVNGQPKTTAEYIQATSRIGRQSPGLVVTVYNWTRPRDISHYERFRSYHGSLYRFVEATSVTPYSSRARDRGLQGMLTSLIRLGDPRMGGEQNADNLDVTDPWVREVLDAITHRAGRVTHSPEVAAETRQDAVGNLDQWANAVKPGNFCYSRRGLGPRANERNPDKRHLLDSQEDRARGGVFEAPSSLREVESEVHVYLLDSELAGEESRND